MRLRIADVEGLDRKGLSVVCLVLLFVSAMIVPVGFAAAADSGSESGSSESGSSESGSSESGSSESGSSEESGSSSDECEGINKDTDPPGKTDIETEQNVRDLAKLLATEASGANEKETRAVGHVVLNRMESPEWGGGVNTKVDAVDDPPQFYHYKDPTERTKRIARDLLNGGNPDFTDGATNYYSPRSMRAHENPDTSGGMEKIPGHPPRPEPGFADRLRDVNLEGVDPWWFKFQSPYEDGANPEGPYNGPDQAMSGGESSSEEESSEEESSEESGSSKDDDCEGHSETGGSATGEDTMDGGSGDLPVVGGPSEEEVSIEKSKGICKDGSELSKLMNLVIQLALWGAIVGVVVLYLVAHFAMVLPISHKQKEKIQKLCDRAVGESLKAVLAGPFAVIVLDAAGYYWATECIDFIPWSGQAT
jgi:spore germination cell wall hydrolase CwlJ-like protein